MHRLSEDSALLTLRLIGSGSGGSGGSGSGSGVGSQTLPIRMELIDRKTLELCLSAPQPVKSLEFVVPESESESASDSEDEAEADAHAPPKPVFKTAVAVTDVAPAPAPDSELVFVEVEGLFEPSTESDFDSLKKVRTVSLPAANRLRACVVLF